MSKILPIISALIFWGIFIYVLLSVPYPETITQANATQLLSFFVSLFLSIVFSLNLFFKNIFMSVFLSLGVILLLFLKALDSLNLVTVCLIAVPVVLLASYFRKNKQSFSLSKKKSLTKGLKIPKLTSLRRQK